MINALNKKQIHTRFYTVLLFFGLMPFCAHAAEVYFKVIPNDVRGDEALIVEAYIDPQSKKINVVDGIISLDGAGQTTLSSVLVETGSSILSRWTVIPVYLEDQGVIRFTGGFPNGFDKSGILFRMRIFAKNEGLLNISWIGGAAYVNDGSGTVENVYARSLTVSIKHGIPNQINRASQDSVPPSFDEIVIGSDKYLYDGNYFVSFHATDDISGVSRYEVHEEGAVTEVSDGVYVLKDQTLNSRVDIIAYDHAGNSKSVQVPRKHKWTINDILIVVIIVSFLILIGLHVYRKHKKIYK